MKLIKLNCEIVIQVSDAETIDDNDNITQALISALELDYPHNLPFSLTSLEIKDREDL